jgi:putative ABC transport system permease protein
MTLLDLARAFRSLLLQRTRAALALLGIIIGTSSLVLLAGLIRSGQDALMAAQQSASESDLLVVRKGSAPSSQLERTRRELSRRDAKSLAASPALGQTWIGTEHSHGSWAEIDGRKKRVTVVSARPDARELYRLSVARGRFLNEDDLTELRRTCVVGHEVWQELLQGNPSMTQRLHIEGDVWSVVGVLAPKPNFSSQLDTSVWDRKVILPETTYDLTYNLERDASDLFVRPSQAESPNPLAALRDITQKSLLRLHYGVKNFELDKKQGDGQGELIGAILYVLLFGTVLVSLFVGGINIMNVMLVSVSERTREIGIRRALGASPGVIRTQFLLEAVVLTSVGGLLGALTGALLCWASALALQRAFGDWPLHIETWAILTGVGSSLVIGITFGLYPAQRAARLEVVEALRRE